MFENIRKMLSPYHRLGECLFSSSDWTGPAAPSKLRQALLIFNNPASRAKLRGVAEQFHPDVLLLHNIYPVGSPGIYAEALDLGVPIVQYIHNFRPFSVGSTLWVGDRIAEESLQRKFWTEIKSGAWQDSRLKSLLFALVMKYLHHKDWLSAVKKWIAISEFMRGKFIEAGIPPEDVVTLIHPWKMLEHEPVGDDGGYYLFLGRLVAEKGVRVLLRAWEILEQETGSSCPRLVIGGEGELEGEVRKAAERSGKIEHRGFLKGDAKQECISKCRAIVAPSVWWEPLGLVTYEAYDHGKPMLAAASGGLSETVSDGCTGFLHTPGDAAALAESVRRLESVGPGGRREMGMEGRAWLAEHTGLEQWRMKFNAIVSDAVNAS